MGVKGLASQQMAARPGQPLGQSLPTLGSQRSAVVLRPHHPPTSFGYHRATRNPTTPKMVVLRGLRLTRPAPPLPTRAGALPIILTDILWPQTGLISAPTMRTTTLRDYLHRPTVARRGR